ncbi:MAG: TlyA family RNA methyltransferase [Halarsenatibacteraceae bacterium]
MNNKERIDIILAERGYFSSRNKAKRAIMAGEVKVDDEVVDKAGTQVSLDANIQVKEKDRYVGRGGHKLARAIDYFKINPENMKALDIGSSTGGFTDCLLQNGARQVYAVDSGYNQLAWRLRQDDRVKVNEKTNFRLLEPGDLPDDFDIIVCDVSFISLKLIIPVAKHFCKEGTKLITLVKPQFEAGPENVGKGGVVRDKAVHKRVLLEVSKVINDEGFQLLDLTYSPITGASSGNIEYLLSAEYNPNKNLTKDDFWNNLINKTIKKADERLRG